MRLAVRAPATAANLGPGFDCLALALGLWNEFELTVEEGAGSGDGGEIAVEGEGAGELADPARNLVAAALRRLAEEAGRGLPPLHLRCVGRIPLERGLGSSATAVVAGVLLADRLLGLDLGPDALLDAAVRIEGHPDNAAACLMGGLVAVYRSGERWRAEPLAPNEELHPVALVPHDERVGTAAARRALPDRVAFEDAAFTAGRAALAVLALTERPDLLFDALEDRLHQPHRLPLAPGSAALFARLRDAGVPVCVAGSGPTLLAFESPGTAVPDPGPGWRALRPGVAREGASIVAG